MFQVDTTRPDGDQVYVIEEGEWAVTEYEESADYSAHPMTWRRLAGDSAGPGHRYSSGAFASVFSEAVAVTRLMCSPQWRAGLSNTDQDIHHATFSHFTSEMSAVIGSRQRFRP